LISSLFANATNLRSDDLTVQVIFFGDGEKTGQITLNLDATAKSNQPLKAKL